MMANKRLIAKLILFCSLLSIPVGLPAEKASPVRVPFAQERKKIIIPTTVNNSKPLNLILDTGMRYDGVILFHKEFAELIDTSGAIDVRVPGAGDSQASTNIMVENAVIGFGEMSQDSQRVVISTSDYTQDFPTDGIIGWNLFGHFAVEINYDSNLIYLHDTPDFKPDSTWTEAPVKMIDNLPYINVELEVVPGEILQMDLYVDLASDKALELLMSDKQRFSMPQASQKVYIGTGLSGDFYGYNGHSHRLKIFANNLYFVPTVFMPAETRSKQEGAEGILGNDAIRRFNIIFDYSHSKVYIKTNNNTFLSFE